MTENKMKKNAKALLYLARELLFSEEGERVPTIPEYAKKFELSVGTIQKALNLLQEENALLLEKKGHLGTYIKKLDFQKLLKLSDLVNIVGVMPLPYTKRYEGLATGIKKCFTDKKINFYFAYMNGSNSRVDLLRQGNYDFAVISNLAFESMVKKDKPIEKIIGFGKQTYVSKHVLLKSKDTKEIKKIGLDKTSEDQVYLTKEYFKGEDCDFIEIEYNKTSELLEKKIVDGVIWNLDEINEKKTNIVHSELHDNKVLNLSSEAVLVINKDNQFIKKIIEKVISTKEVIEIQNDVLNEKLIPIY